MRPNDLTQRLIFGEWALEQLLENPLFYRKILFSDEAHFWLNGYLNKHIRRISRDEGPHAIQELPMHPEKTTVWLWNGGIVGPFSFNDDRGRTNNGKKLNRTKWWRKNYFRWPQEFTIKILCSSQRFTLCIVLYCIDSITYLYARNNSTYKNVSNFKWNNSKSSRILI